MPAEADQAAAPGGGFTCIGAALARAAAHFGLDRRRALLVGVEAEFRKLRLAAELRPGFVDDRLMPGCICWIFSGADGTTTVGVACRRRRKPDLEALLKRLAPLADFDAAELLEKRGGLVGPAGCKALLSRSACRRWPSPAPAPPPAAPWRRDAAPR